MEISTTIRSLHEKHRAAIELENTPIPGFTSEQLASLASACGHSLPDSLKAILRADGIFADAPDLYFEDVGYVVLGSPESIIETAQSLRNAVEEYEWEVPACCAFSLINNEYVALDIESGDVIAICGDDGEVTPMGFDFQGLLGKYAELWKAQLEN